MSTLRRSAGTLPCHPVLRGGDSDREEKHSNSIPDHPLFQSASHGQNEKELQIMDTRQCPNPACDTQSANSRDNVTSRLQLCDATSLSSVPTSLYPSGDCDGVGANSGPDSGGSSGYSMATGLSLLVEKCLGKPLDKSQQLSDWERRPLREKQIRYAGIVHCTAYGT